MSDERLGKVYRIGRQADFDRVYERGAHAADRVLVVRGCQNDLGYSRLGLSMSRKVGGAVVRNRWKRLIREAFRLNRRAIPAGLDLIVRPRRGAQCDYQAVQQSLPRLASRVARQLQKKGE